MKRYLERREHNGVKMTLDIGAANIELLMMSGKTMHVGAMEVSERGMAATGEAGGWNVSRLVTNGP